MQYTLVREVAGGSLLEIDLRTGRKHQIRVQLAARGLTIWGERKYAAGKPFAAGLALHARRLAFEHPVQKTAIELVAPLPPAWRRLGLA